MLLILVDCTNKGELACSCVGVRCCVGISGTCFPLAGEISFSFTTSLLPACGCEACNICFSLTMTLLSEVKAGVFATSVALGFAGMMLFGFCEGVSFSNAVVFTETNA
ncbi:MAG: hypothetical protein COB81_08490 [Flavobacteriaceae bacterium]|nr:MAG: hypothetical protein COB81_08490 [Flavobacteriaceae bacterium]